MLGDAVNGLSTILHYFSFEVTGGVVNALSTILH